MIELDEARCEVRRFGKEVNLTPKEYQIMTTLVDAQGEVVSRDEIIERAWDRDSRASSVGEVLDHLVVNQHIRRLRSKIVFETIITVTGRGFKAARGAFKRTSFQWS